MEAAVGLIALIALIVFLARNRRGTEDVIDSSRNAYVKPKVLPKPIADSQNPERKYSPFDAKTVNPQAKVSIIEGAAYVIDGDSLVIKKTQVRLFGVDAPELNHPFGKKAKWALLALCKGQTIRAEITQTDAYGRTVAKCFLPDGTDLSAEMVKIGLAIDWPKYSGGKYAQLEIPDARKKMWLADARQKGRLHVWKKFEARQAASSAKQ